MQQQQTVSWIVICNEKWILYNWQWPAQWLDLRSPSALPKAKLVPKSSHSLWQAAASLIHCSFLNHIETITYEKYTQQINEMCQPALVDRKGLVFLYDNPDHTSHNQHFKSWTNWATKFCLICHIHVTSSQPSTMSSRVSITFCMKNSSTTIRRQKMFSKNSSNTQVQIFML